MLELKEQELINAIESANKQIAFEDDELKKQYFRGMKDTLIMLLKRCSI